MANDARQARRSPGVAARPRHLADNSQNLGRLRMSLSKKIKVGLDETRILILGSQILLGFGFQLAFRPGFQDPSKLDETFAVAAVVLITLTVGLIISPSIQHRIVEEGKDTLRLVGAIRRYAAYALAPFAIALGIDVFLATERVAGRVAGLAGAALGAAAGFFWYGYAYWKRRKQKNGSGGGLEARR